MSGHSTPLPGDVRETVLDLRRRLGLFSFQHDAQNNDDSLMYGPCPDLGLRPGGIVEWLTAAPGAGAVASTMQMMSRHFAAQGILAIVDSARECHAPALSGWGFTLSRTLLVRPRTRQEACWAIEQCLRCPGVSATWAWVDQRFPARVHRRWQSAAEVGGGVGMIFRPETARREPTWADLRLLVTPLAGRSGRIPDGCGSTSSITGAVWEVPPRSGRSTMPRVLCVWFPRWPIQRLRNEQPELRRSELVLFAGHNQRPCVTVCGPKAERLGVRVGQPLAEAKALFRKAVFLPADVVADREALCQLALDGQRFSPLVGLEEGIPPESLLSRRHRLHASLGWRGADSPGCSRPLDGARLSDPTCPGRHRGSRVGGRSRGDRRRGPRRG